MMLMQIIIEMPLLYFRDFQNGVEKLWLRARHVLILKIKVDKVEEPGTEFMLVADRTIASWSLWAAIVRLCREILVSGLREFLAELKVSVPVSAVAKWKTTVQLIALGFLIAGRAGEHVLPGTTRIGLVLLWVAALLTLYTGWDYMKAGLKHVTKEAP